jgi:hypothetical protein
MDPGSESTYALSKNLRGQCTPWIEWIALAFSFSMLIFSSFSCSSRDKILVPVSSSE